MLQPDEKNFLIETAAGHPAAAGAILRHALAIETRGAFPSVW